MNKQFSTKEVASELVVSEQTIRLWAKTFEIPYTKSSGNIRFSNDAVEIFERIKYLRDDNSGFETIRKKIFPDSQVFQNEDKTASDVKSKNLVKTQDNLENNIEKIIASSIKQSFSEHTELSEKYARATYRIGELETTVRFLQEKISTQEKQLETIEEPIQFSPPQPKRWWQKFFKS